MSRQLTQLIALGLADWFLDECDDPRFAQLNNLDPDRHDGCGDPFDLVAAAEERSGIPLALTDDPPDSLDALIRAALLWHDEGDLP
jgi:hypothetical protein